ncbi:hypothetical protein [uncultured Methanobrevibacter sp.]|uniref:hypothetical protein n=1 Tax=uncultured Methanobrevibacter sp. TaxID=253161 RepID=UPI0025EB2927|nr:hypothetical protein [uncultured Methanobrevibacter sp.]
MDKKIKIISFIGLIIIFSIILSSAIFADAIIDSSNNKGKLTLNGETKQINEGKYYTNQSNTNTLLLMNGGKLDASSLQIIKEGSSESKTNSSNTLDKSPNDKGEGKASQAPPDNGTNPTSDGVPSGNAGGSSPGDVPPSGGESSGSAPPENGGESASEDSEFYGTNSAVLTLYDSNATIFDSQITTNANGANAIFATNNDSSHKGAIISLKNVEIQTYQDKSRGLDATYGGIINAENVQINTRGGSCAAVATDRGEGIVNVDGSTLNTGVDGGTGAGSPCIYSTGNITVKKSKGTANNAQIACIEGKNSIDIKNSEFTCSGKGNRESNGQYVDLAGIFIYQSMSGDADEGTAQFNANNAKLSISSSSKYYDTAPMFHVTNTASNISISDTTLEFGSNILLNVSAQDQWGDTGSNGGDVQFKSTNEELKGNIFVDNISSLKFNLKNTLLKGAINPQNNYGDTNLTIESDAQWTLTGNSHLTNLTNKGTIDYGAYTLYVNGKAYNASNPYKG